MSATSLRPRSRLVPFQIIFAAHHPYHVITQNPFIPNEVREVRNPSVASALPLASCHWQLRRFHPDPLREYHETPKHKGDAQQDDQRPQIHISLRPKENV